MNGACNVKLLLAPGPGEGSKGQISFSITKSISKILIPNFVCVLTHEKYKTYQNGFSFCRLGHAPLTLGCWVGQKLQHGDLRWGPIDCAF